jgi:hypothetical protein
MTYEKCNLCEKEVEIFNVLGDYCVDCWDRLTHPNIGFSRNTNIICDNNTRIQCRQMEYSQRYSLDNHRLTS